MSLSPVKSGPNVDVPSLAKAILYKTNGSGRDTYIKNNNGGMTVDYKPYNPGELGSFSPRRKYVEPMPTLPGKMVYYRSDGTGRDSYIMSSSGGFHTAVKGQMWQKQFMAGLRDYEGEQRAPPKNKRVDFSSLGKTFLYPKDSQRLVEQRVAQKKLDERLSMPKHSRKTSF